MVALTAPQIARMILAQAPRLTPAQERAAWAATLQHATPQERLEIARAAWIDLRAYSYDQTGERIA